MSVLSRIQQRYNTLPAKEQQIARYVLEKSGHIKNISIIELAEQTKTSISTITRFCKRIDCESFVDFKLQLNAAPEYTPPAEYDSIFKEVYSLYHKVIDNTVKNINQDKIKAMVDLLKTAKRIYICGIGSSGLTAVEMAQRLIRMGLNATSINDSHMMIITSSITTEEDFVIGISNSGTTPEVLTTLKNAKRNKSKVAAFTSFEQSEMAKMSDLLFPVYNPLFVSDKYFVNSQFSIMYIIDIISMTLIQSDNYREKMEKTISSITEELRG